MENQESLRDVMTEHYARLAKEAQKPFAYDSGKPLGPQQEALRNKYRELLHMPGPFTAPPRIEYVRNDDPAYDEVRFLIESEPDFFVPAHLLLPKNRGAEEKLPVIICLQGHSTGMHISLGRPIYPNDQKTIDGDRDFAIQAVRRGYAAVAMEQRGFGELKSMITDRKGCHQAAMQALLVGRTLLGERIRDITRLIDALETFQELDMGRVSIMGNSGGGTAAYHAAGVEPRVHAVLASCSFNRYDRSILPMSHCDCNYVPGFAANFEMPDLAMLIAPRPLLVVSGKEDVIFPLDAAREGFEKVKQIYRAAGAENNCCMIEGNGGHRFYSADAWPVFDKMV